MVQQVPPPEFVDGCWLCELLAGHRSASGLPYVYESEGFIVDHAFPVDHLGWFVISTRRHVSGFQQLSSSEWSELGLLVPRVVAAVGETLEIPGTMFMKVPRQTARHFHWDIVAKLRDNDLRDAESLRAAPPTKPLGVEQLASTCNRVRRLLREPVATAPWSVATRSGVNDKTNPGPNSN